MEGRARNAGILAMEVYFPVTFVNQQKLEEFDGVSPGKYTIGLGQNNMACVGDDEDAASIALTAVSSLMRKYSIPYDKIGRLEVGTESLIDKCKSVKTTLMQLFHNHQNYHLQGVDCINACYGGTSALLNAVHWIASDYWDEKSLAIVVAVDIAIYAAGSARCSGGVGAVAMLIGENAPLHIEPKLEGTYMRDVHDFYKPVGISSEYPIVNGKYSIDSYLLALHYAYKQYKSKFKLKFGTSFCLDHADYLLFHCPYSKLVQKAFANMMLDDFICSLEDHAAGNKNSCRACNERWAKVHSMKEAALQLQSQRESNYSNRELEDAFIKLSQPDFTAKVLPSLYLAKEVGNMYCASLYGSLISLLHNIQAQNLVGKRLLLFSYGSGLAASLFSIHVRPGFESILNSIVEKVNLGQRLANRIEVSPTEFTQLLDLREKMYTSSDYIPKHTQHQTDSTYYIKAIDKNYQRMYQTKQTDTL
jgi:hydroxymethylglutaryl-CoA synthase